MPANNRIPKATQRRLAKATTVDDLLARDDINAILAELTECKGEMVGLIAIAVYQKDGMIYYHSEMPMAALVYNLEQTKFALMIDNEDED